MTKIDGHFEIIEDQPLPRKRKAKRKDSPSLNYIPWRVMMIALAAGIVLGMGLLFVLVKSRRAAPVEVPDLSLIMGDKHVMGDITDIAYSGSHLIAVDAAHVTLYNGVNFSQHLDITTSSIILSPDGTRLASLANVFDQHYTLLQIWDVAMGRLLEDAKIDGDNMPVSAGGKSFVFSPDSRLLAVNTRSATFILDAQTLAIRTTIAEHEMGAIDMVFSPDASDLITIFEHDEPNFDIKALAQVWDIRDPRAPQLAYSLHIPEGTARDAVLSADGHYLAYTEVLDAHTKPTYRIYIHDMLAQKDIGIIPFGNNIRIAALALSDSHLAFTQWDTATTAVSSTVVQYHLHVVRWSTSPDRFHYQTQSMLLPPTLDVVHLHLWNDHLSSGLDYFLPDTATLIRWNFSANTIQTLAL